MLFDNDLGVLVRRDPVTTVTALHTLVQGGVTVHTNPLLVTEMQLLVEVAVKKMGDQNHLILQLQRPHYDASAGQYAWSTFPD